MKRATGFLILVVVDLIAFGLLVAWYLGVYQPRGESIGGMMGQMMGSYGGGGPALAMPSGVWVALVSMAAIGVAGAVGAGYFAAYPEITLRPPATGAEAPRESGTQGESWEALVRTSKPEERRVLEVLAAHGGSYLQKFVVKETGLSKLKTHRIVSRLAERGVVGVERSGNTNQVSLAPWLRGEAVESPQSE